MRTKFEGHEVNKPDTHAIIWKWKSCIIDFSIHDDIGFERALQYVGFPSEEERKWRNGDFSTEYNNSLNDLLRLGFVEIIKDQLYPEGETNPEEDIDQKEARKKDKLLELYQMTLNAQNTLEEINKLEKEITLLKEKR